MLKTLTKEDEEEIERLREERRTKRRNDPISKEGEEVNQEVEESEHESNENVPMEEEESEEEEDELPMYQEHYDALFSMDFVETKYPHDDTMRALGIFEDVELVLKNMRLAKFFSYRLESYKELTCEFLASMRFHKYRQLDRAELDQGWGWITFLARGERKAAQIRSPVLRYVHKALANTFFARKATGTINEGEVKLLDMGIKPIISRTKDGKKSEEIESMQGISCLSLTSYSPTRQPPIALGFKRVGSLVLEESSRLSSVQLESIWTREVGHEEDLREEEPELDRAEDRVEDHAQVNADLGEPECYYFEEYEAPRMNPSVVAAHKRIGLLQRFNKWQGKAMDKMQKSMDKMVSKIKSLEKKVSGSSSKKKKTPMAPTFPRSRSLLTTPRRSFGAFWSIWDMRSMEGLGMDAAQLDTQRKKGEAILKTSSTLLDQPVEFLNSTGQASTRSS
ncbi:unnamed protein product [Microthlaspi erraticum]|uniref:Arabidopsis retrotransposon Orf1 C-terminal domain-containing protein n=1 Tax=Microthlaspi erraticum TaxID=1685480 RepID=A0A6D2HPN1_9BRAS|nr:unnamed protein product [Microthlaspi erraticum]